MNFSNPKEVEKAFRAYSGVCGEGEAGAEECGAEECDLEKLSAEVAAQIQYEGRIIEEGIIELKKQAVNNLPNWAKEALKNQDVLGNLNNDGKVVYIGLVKSLPGYFRISGAKSKKGFIEGIVNKAGKKINYRAFIQADKPLYTPRW